MTAVSLQGQGGSLPHAVWTLASMLNFAHYNRYFTGEWHVGESDYALPSAQGFDDMEHVGLSHPDACPYADPKWFPEINQQTRDLFARVTTVMLSNKAAAKAHEDSRLNGQYRNEPEKRIVGIPFVDRYIEKAALALSTKRRSAGSRNGAWQDVYPDAGHTPVRGTKAPTP